MQRSTDRILTTHTGSLPRPDDLTEMLAQKDHGEQAEVAGLDARVTEAVAELVQRQADAGIRVVNDGEASKFLYATYVRERVDGFGDAAVDAPSQPDGDGASEVFELEGLPPEFKEYASYYAQIMEGVTFAKPSCVGPLSYRDLEPVRRDIENLRNAIQAVDVDEAFMTAASPGCIAAFLDNRYYATDEEYIWALAEAMKPEYDAIHAAGLLVQLDCPELAISIPWLPEPERNLQVHIEALNHATRDIPPDRMRMHLCWGNSEAPHTSDVPLASFIDAVFTARPAAIVFEAANPRHGHEWRVFEETKLPEGKVLVPGVIDSTTNYVEHPRLVADRIVQYARLVGPENVIAGTDCGFATAADRLLVHPQITWAKLGALSEGAEIASRELF